MSERPFRVLFHQLMDYSGIKEEDFQKILRSNGVLTDEMVFTISRYINDLKGINVFFTRKFGDFEIRVRFFDIAVDYVFYNKNKQIAAIVSTNLQDLSFVVEFPIIEEKYTIDKDLLDFEEEKKNKLSILRMQVLNEALTRYYSKILYSIYLQIRRR